MVPPPPPQREAPKIITIKQHEKLLPSNPNAWKPGRLQHRTTSKDEVAPKTEEELIIEVSL